METIEDPLKCSGQRQQINFLKEELYKAEMCMFYLYLFVHF